MGEPRGHLPAVGAFSSGLCAQLPVSGLFNSLFSAHALEGEKAAPATRMEVCGHDMGRVDDLGGVYV